MNNKKLYESILKINTNLLSKFEKLENRINLIEKDIVNVENSILKLKKDIKSYDNHLNEKMNVLFDGYKQNIDFYDYLEKKLRYASKIVETHDVKIQVFESQLKQVNS
ncbi:MAG: hypothetical protein ABF289_07025 [Clostridiales bacterium]